MDAKRIEHEIDEAEYEDILTEIYGDIEVCGMPFCTGYALRALDPTAFRCGKSDYEAQLDEESPEWECAECGERYDDEDDANECCLPEECNEE